MLSLIFTCGVAHAHYLTTSGGALYDCASAKLAAGGECSSDSFTNATHPEEGAPEGWLLDRCPRTCGVCEPHGSCEDHDDQLRDDR